MIAVITGDIINSQEGNPNKWLNDLKETLNNYGESPLDWQIYRGDSFQIKVESKIAVLVAIHIKLTIKLEKGLDVRMGIGLGEMNHSEEEITQSNGSAFVHSGICFEELNKQTLGFRSDNEEINSILNAMFPLAMFIADNWSPLVAKVIKVKLENPGLNQKALAKKLSRSQSSVSEVLKRGGLDEIMRMNEYYQNSIEKI
jgi:antitoxin component HigA of HigAB toxin-antitoxin module